MHRILPPLLLGALALAGCVSPSAEVGRVLDRRVQGDAMHAFVPGYTSDLALPFALAHCNRFGKATRFRRMEAGGALYDCVDR